MSPLARLVPCVLRYRRQFLQGLLCLVLTTAFSLLGPWVLRYAVDDLTAGVTRDKLAVHAATLLGLAVAGGGFRFLMRRILVGASRAIEYDLRNAFVAHLQRMPPAWFHATRTGDLMSRATNDLNAVRMMVGPAVMYMASTGLVFVVSVALMLSIDPVLTLVALACLPLVSLAVKFFGSAVYRHTEQIQAQLSTLSAVVHEGLAGVRVVRAYCREAVETERFARENREYFDRNARLIRVQALFYPSLGFILGLAGVLVLWLGARHVIEGRITVGQFVAFNAYLLMLSWPMIAFGFVTNLFQRGMAAWGRMCDVLDAPPAEPAAVTMAPAAPPAPGTGARGDIEPHTGTGGWRRGPGRELAGGVEFRDLTFAYDGRPVLEGVSARVEPGRVLGVIGPTGSGKSTLLALLPRLFNPPRGTVLVDGIDVLDLPLPVLRRQIAMVPQDPFLFSDTIAGNVSFGVAPAAAPAVGNAAAGDPYASDPEAGAADAGVAEAGAADAGDPGFGDPDAGGGDVGDAGAGDPDAVAGDAARDADASRDPEAVVTEALALARLDKDIADFPDGAATRVGERGVTLSGGQKQRTALARAISADAPILLLDDALSAADAGTEADILAGLRRVLCGRTSIIVSHRISTVRAADLILVLDAGRVVERGSHDELVALGGLYAGLHRKQLIERALEQG